MRILTLITVVLAICAPVAAGGKDRPVNVLETKRLSTHGSTRATAYAMSNKIITAKGKVFMAWLDFVADIKMATYDVKEKAWSEPVLVGKGVDNHSGPAITMDSAGHLYIAYGPHGGPFQFRRSKQPYDMTAWGPTQRFGVNATYPSLVCDANDTLHVAYRGGKRPHRLMYQRRPKSGKWSRPRELVDPAVPPCYTQYGNALAVAKDGTLHLAFHIYSGDARKGRGHSIGYLRSRDGGDTWETADGVAMTTPVTPKSACFIEQGPKLDARAGALVLDPDGRPWFPALHLETSPRTVLLWHHDGRQWTSRDLLPAVRKRMPGREVAMGTMTFDRDGALYVAAVVLRPGAPDQTWFGHPSMEVALMTSRNGGKTFTVQLVSTPDPKLPSWLPSLERPFSHKPIGVPAFLYTHGNKGEFGKNKEGTPTEVFFVGLTK